MRKTVTLALAAAALTLGLAAPTAGSAAPAARVEGIDVSHHQGKIDWSRVRAAGTQFAYVKATEGSSYRDPTFNVNYTGSYRAGIIRGAYHFANPAGASGGVQADYFIANGGGWSADGRTLPGMLDMEAPRCAGISKAAMVAWIRAFIDRYHARTSRWPVIYTGPSWWSTCTGNYSGFAAQSPLMLARYNTAPGTPPGSWATWTIWQYTEDGRVDGVSGDVDRDVFNGSRDRLLALADNTK